jgi:hypothetical protein
MTPTRTRTLLLVAVAFAAAPVAVDDGACAGDRRRGGGREWPRAARTNPRPSRDQTAIAVARRADGGAGESLLAGRGRNRGTRDRIRGGGGRFATGCRATPRHHRRRHHAGHVGAPRPRGAVPGALLPCAGRSGSGPVRPAATVRGSLSLRAVLCWPGGRPPGTPRMRCTGPGGDPPGTPRMRSAPRGGTSPTHRPLTGHKARVAGPVASASP